MYQWDVFQDDFTQKPGSVITSVVRDNAPPCDHYTTTIYEESGNIVTLTFASAELLDPVTDDERRVIARVWGKLQHGGRLRPVSDFVGAQIFAEIP